MKSRKKFGLIFGVIGLAILILGGIGGKIYMDRKAEYQAQVQEQKANAEKIIAKDKEEITEIFEWNYDNVQSVTFEFLPSKADGTLPTNLGQCIRTTPAGGLYINGFVNNNKSLVFSVNLNVDTFKLSEVPQIFKTGGNNYEEGLFREFKNPTLNEGKLLPSRETCFLSYEDIGKLKSQGYTNDITFEQIRHYFEGEKQ